MSSTPSVLSGRRSVRLLSSSIQSSKAYVLILKRAARRTLGQRGRDKNSLVYALRKLASEGCEGRASLMREISARWLPSEAVADKYNQGKREDGDGQYFSDQGWEGGKHNLVGSRRRNLRLQAHPPALSGSDMVWPGYPLMPDGSDTSGEDVDDVALV